MTVAPRCSEKQVEHAGDRLMALHGFTAVRFSQARATQQTPGIPDRRYYHGAWGVALWWEAKRPGGKQRLAQRQFQVLVEACGEHYVVGDLDALVAAVTPIIRAHRARRAPGEPAR